MPIDDTNVAALTVGGRYRAGASDGSALPGYAEEIGRKERHKREIDRTRRLG